MRYLCLLVCLLCLACDTAAPVTPTPIAPLSFTGTGDTDTARFALPEGDYTLRWQGYPNSDPRCVLIGRLFPADPTNSIEFGATVSGQTRVNGLRAGMYYLHIAAGACAWGVTVEAAP
jgi:hypothetical protein